MNNYRFFDKNSTPNNWIFNRLEHLPLPYLDFITNNIDLIMNTQDVLICIRCTKEIDFHNYGDIEKFCYLNSVFCPECNINMIVPKSKIPDPFDTILSMWHMLAFGMFANKPISSEDESKSECDSGSDMS